MIMENENVSDSLIGIVGEAVKLAVEPLQKRIISLEKLSKAQEEPEFPFDVWDRATKQAFGSNYKIY